jgi:hypothetical protein
MKITRRSPFDGVERTLEMDITEEQYIAWHEGMVAQLAFPHLTLDEREFIISGISPECWATAMTDPEENSVTNME